MRALLDVNVWIAFFDDAHQFSDRANLFIAKKGVKIATCLLVETGVARVMSSPHYSRRSAPAIQQAASSLVCSCAIAFQNGHHSARCSTGGLPGERSLGRNDRSDFSFFTFINTSRKVVLRRLVEITQYTCVDFGKRYKEMGVRPSMSTLGDDYDKAVAESFFASLECELIDRRNWKSPAEARMAIFTWIEGWYNPRRRHSGIGQKSPINFEKGNAQQSQRRHALHR